MNLIQLIACAGLITGCFVLLRISPMDFTEGVFSRITSKPKSIRAEINESTRRKRKSILRREIEEAQTILRMTGRLCLGAGKFLPNAGAGGGHDVCAILVYQADGEPL